MAVYVPIKRSLSHVEITKIELIKGRLKYFNISGAEVLSEPSPNLL